MQCTYCKQEYVMGTEHFTTTGYCKRRPRKTKQGNSVYNVRHGHDD